MVSTPKPVRQKLKKAASNYKKMLKDPEMKKQFGNPTKQSAKKQMKQHSGRVKQKYKKTGSI